ncbi:transporter substrate-binding domain-containing protein [Carnimonas bestiolae]|uniref:transporter substrate-binding domain-containing protein n=1 Tax=Carnimonas bestiolae TaxID=3402172 RepID=UPI003EDBD72A
MKRATFLTLSLLAAVPLVLSPLASAAERVNVAVEAGSKPLSFEDDEGQLTGYEVDILKAVDKALPDYEFNIEAVTPNAAEVGLVTGHYALMGGGLYKNAQREKRYLFTGEPTGASVITIYVKQGRDDIHSLDDLIGKKVAPVTPSGGIYTMLKEFNEAHEHKIDFKGAQGISSADKLKRLDSGVYDAIVSPNNVGFDQINSQLGLHTEAVAPIKVNSTWFALNKRETRLKSEVDRELKTLREDGTLSKLSEKWFGTDNIKYLSSNNDGE